MTFAQFFHRSFSASCLSLLLVLSGCGINEMESGSEQPTISADLYNPQNGSNRGGCTCTNGCNQFSTLHTVSSNIPAQVPFGGMYHYAVTVTPSSSCNPALAGGNCALYRRDFHLDFNPSSFPSYSAYNFENISLFDLEGQPLSYSIKPGGTGILANEPFVACFRFKTQYASNPLTSVHLRSGGICIIGIITDPSGGGGNGGGTGSSSSNG